MLKRVSIYYYHVLILKHYMGVLAIKKNRQGMKYQYLHFI